MNLTSPVQSIMTGSPITVREDTTMDIVVDKLNNSKIHHMPVVNNLDNCIGVISSHDTNIIHDKFYLFQTKQGIISTNSFLKSLLAKEIMTVEPISLSADSPISAAVDIFLENNIHSIIITDDGKLTGIVTPLDIMKQLKN